ncbi:MAG: hypothetical protein A2X29_01570 [Elusimicrobia bacterium GWA2_64_40]|nr:MAG: hypothetical protein A2X29_01570 [Elusimicrobia bacterium GWA2_64_40]OGR66717.1 MAG: hypothetical protein A2X30_06910 [Elusimicrobia bacterium GWB2_63_16]HAN04858.1 hypothetical protein [Elusimicrobiota bacterium]
MNFAPGQKSERVQQAKAASEKDNGEVADRAVSEGGEALNLVYVGFGQGQPLDIFIRRIKML